MTQKFFIMKIFAMLLVAMALKLTVENSESVAHNETYDRTTEDRLRENEESRNDSILYNDNSSKLSVSGTSNNKLDNNNNELYVKEIKEPRRLKNTIENFIRKICFFITIYLFNASGGTFNMINLLDYGMIGIRVLLPFVPNSVLEKLYEEFLPIYITIVLFRLILGNAMSLTNISTCVFTGTYSLWQYGIIVAAIFAVPVGICYLLKEGKSFSAKRKIQKAILIGICFYYSFFVFSPFGFLINEDGSLIDFSSGSGVGYVLYQLLGWLAPILSFVIKLLDITVTQKLTQAFVTLIRCISLYFSSYLILKIYDHVTKINSSNIFEIAWQFYFGENVDTEDRTIVISSRKEQNN